VPALTVLSLLVAVAAAAVWSRRPAVVAASGCAAAVMSLTGTAFAGPGGAATAYWMLAEVIITLVVVAKAVRWLPLPMAITVAAVLIAAVGLAPLRVARWLQPPAPAVETVAVCACSAVLAALAVVAGTYLRALDHARTRVVAATRREQRLTLARDLHDWFAHEVTGIVLEAQAGRLDADPRTAETFGRIERAGQRALDSVDQALTLMRSSEHATGFAEIEEIVRRFAEGGRMSVELDTEPTGDLRPETTDTAYRVVSEALTNIRRHGGTASHVVVRIRREADTLTVAVTDDGAGRRPRARRRGGTGLTALAERIAALGGTLHAGPTDTPGWTVRAAIPAPP
jgi:signal transduction histidine kinase